MAAAPSTYKRGSQDIRDNIDSYGWFWFWTKAGIVSCIALLLLLAWLFT